MIGFVIDHNSLFRRVIFANHFDDQLASFTGRIAGQAPYFGIHP